MSNISDPHDDPTTWFEPLYAEAAKGARVIPWDHHAPHPLLVSWASREAIDGHGRRAIVVGTGTGDDAAYVASLGYETTAFDVAPSAIATARARYPEAAVAFTVADLFNLPPGWTGAFDQVVEIHTVQALPRSMREPAISAVVSLVAPGGHVVVIAAALDMAREDGPPWPLTRDELDGFARAGLTQIAVDREYGVGAGPFASHWLAEYERPA